jgi:hypothetical protein
MILFSVRRIDPRNRVQHELGFGPGPQSKLHYSAKDRKGFDHVLPTVVRGGRAVPFTDWSTAAPH